MRLRRVPAWSVLRCEWVGCEGRGPGGLPARRDATLPRLATECSNGVFVPCRSVGGLHAAEAMSAGANLRCPMPCGRSPIEEVLRQL